MKLNPKAFAITAGLMWGFGLFLVTIWLLIIGSRGETISLIGKFYFGYSLSVVGAFLGLLWGFIDGLIGGFLFAWIYNKFLPKES
ncbi:MAG: bacteriophage holin [Calditrichia bacterium]